MNSEDVQKLRNQVLDELIKLVDEVGVEPEDKYNIIISRYIAIGDTALLRDAYNIALTITSPKERAAALLQVLSEIDIIGETPILENNEALKDNGVGNEESSQNT